jgi:hypothetical protein
LNLKKGGRCEAPKVERQLHCRETCFVEFQIRLCSPTALQMPPNLGVYVIHHSAIVALLCVGVLLVVTNRFGYMKVKKFARFQVELILNADTGIRSVAATTTAFVTGGQITGNIKLGGIFDANMVETRKKFFTIK